MMIYPCPPALKSKLRIFKRIPIVAYWVLLQKFGLRMALPDALITTPVIQASWLLNCCSIIPLCIRPGCFVKRSLRRSAYIQRIWLVNLQKTMSTFRASCGSLMWQICPNALWFIGRCKIVCPV